MKRKIVWLSLLLACILMLTACDSLMPAPMTAGQLERRANRNMEKLQNYRVDIEMTYRVFVGSTKVTGTAKGVVIEDKGESKNDFYTYMEMTNELKSGSNSFRLRNVEAYIDGTAYSLFGDGNVTRKLYSEMTQKEYAKYRQGDSLIEMDLENCKNTEMEKTDNGYLLKYSGYSEESVAEFAKASGLEKDVYGEDLKDLNVTIEISKDYMFNKITLEPVFDVQEGAYYQPKVSITMTFSQFNEAERITKGFSTQQYTQIESLLLLNELEQMIDDRADAKKGSFTYTASQTVTFMAQTEKQDQTSKVSYERTKDGLTFSADVSGDSAKSSHIEYSNGEKITETNGKTHTNKMTEDEARAFIAELINDPAMGYNTNYVSKIEKTDNGYLVTMAVSKYSALGQSIASSGASFGNGKHTIAFVLDGDKLKSIKVDYSGQGAVTLDFGWDTSIATLHLKGNISVTFD